MMPELHIIDAYCERAGQSWWWIVQNLKRSDYDIARGIEKLVTKQSDRRPWWIDTYFDGDQC